MKDKVREFLESDLLERYLMEATDEAEAERVERYVALYPEVREAYAELQENLEAFARLYAQKAPEGMVERVLEGIRNQGATKSRSYWWAVAASAVAVILIGANFNFYRQNQDLMQQNDRVNREMKTLKADMARGLEDIRNQYIVLNNPNTRTYRIKGNRKASELKAVAYVNPIKKLSYINVEHLPQLPEDRCYQMWAEVNGDLVDLGVIRQDRSSDELLALPYAEDAISYITIEPEGGNPTPTVGNIVAELTGPGGR